MTEELKNYAVHVYREVRVSFYGIRATSDEDAASQARLLRTERGETSHDDTTDFRAIVESEDDDENSPARVVTFKEGRLHAAASDLLQALELITGFMCANIHGEGELEAIRKADAAIAQAKGGAQ